MPKLDSLPEYMFTYAKLVISKTRHTVGAGSLVFGTSLPDSECLLDPEMYMDIAGSTYVEESLGFPFVIMPVKVPYRLSRYGAGTDSKHVLVATNTFSTLLAIQLENTVKTSPLWVVHSPERIEKLTGLSAYTRCQYMHKLVKGCSACFLDLASDRNIRACPLIEVQLANAEPTPDLDEFKGHTDYWKTKIGRFVAVSPVLTVPPYLQRVGIESARPANEHSFADVPKNFEQRSNASTRAHRTKKFAAEVCPQCAVFRSCDNVKWCSGPYGKTEEELQRKVLDRCGSSGYKTFTDHQLLYLLQNSGDCDRRLDSFKIYGTLKLSDGITYALRRSSAQRGPETVMQTQNFKEAKRWIKKYYSTVTETPPRARLNPHTKAVLFELLNHDYSPTHGGGWHKTSYATQGIHAYGYNTLRVDYHVRWGDGRLHWSLDAENLVQLYACYGRFLTIQNEPHPLGRGN